MDAVTHLLARLGWKRLPDLVVAKYTDRPVYGKGQWKVVVGPLWTSYHSLLGETITILEQDSLKTEDFEGIERKVRELTRSMKVTS